MNTQATGGVDMGKLRDSIESILNAIVQSTELAKQVEVMTRDVGQLRQDIDTTQARNVELDRMLHDTREQRDRAESELAIGRKALEEATYNLNKANDKAMGLEADRNSVLIDLSQVRKERDEYGMNAMSIQEALDKANAKLASIHQTMGIEFKPFEVPKPEPTPEPIIAKVTEHWDEPETIKPWTPPSPYKIYKGDPGYVDAKAQLWEDGKGWYHYSDVA